jgi:hypothetical protein
MTKFVTLDGWLILMAQRFFQKISMISGSHAPHGNPFRPVLQAVVFQYRAKSYTGCDASRLHSHAAHGNEMRELFLLI